MEDIALYYSVRNPILSVDSITDRVASQGIANPYVMLEDGTYHVFFNTIQAYNPSTGVTADEIAHAWSTDLQQWNYTQVVLGVVPLAQMSLLLMSLCIKMSTIWYRI